MRRPTRRQGKAGGGSAGGCLLLLLHRAQPAPSTAPRPAPLSLRHQAWLYWNPGRRSVCVAFRGTEQGKWRDILTDLHLVPAPLDPERVAAAPRSAALAEASAPPQPPSRLTRILGG